MASNYASIIANTQRANQSILNTNAETAVDFTKIANEAIKGRSAERRAAIAAKAQVASQGLKSQATAKVYEIDADAKKDVESIMQPAKRFAGVVGAAGTMASAYVMKQGNDRAEQRHQERMAALERNRQATLTALQNSDPGPPPELEPMPRQDQIEFAPSPSPSASPTASPTPSPTPSPTASGGDLSMSYMKALTADGYTPTQAAALVGHLRVETGDFRHMEELEDNVYGTRGYGHLQWSNTPGSNRRDNFINWTRGQKLDPTSFEGNYGFLKHEMTTNHGNVWTNGGNDQGFRQTGSLEDSSSYLHGNFIRPSPGSENERIRRAKETLAQWQALTTS